MWYAVVRACMLALAGAFALAPVGFCQPDMNAVRTALAERERTMRQLFTRWDMTRSLPTFNRNTPNERTNKKSLFTVDHFAEGVHLVFQDIGDPPGTRFDFALPVETPFGIIVYAFPPDAKPNASPDTLPKGLFANFCNYLPPRLLGIVLLSGLNPLRFVDIKQMQVSEEGNMVVMRAPLAEDMRPHGRPIHTLVLKLDPQRAFSPVWAQVLAGDRPAETAAVLSSRKHGTCWLPETVTVEQDIETCRLTLREVQPSSGKAPWWAGQGISDWRLGSGMGETVRYGFTWRLPSLRELQQKMKDLREPAKGKSHSGGLRLVPPFF